MYLSTYVNEVLESKKDKLTGWNPYYRIVSALNKSFGEKNLKFRYERFDSILRDDYSVSGLYDMSKDVRYIILNFSNQHYDFRLPPNKWKEFKFLISQTIQHETIHQLQWQKKPEECEYVHLDFRNIASEGDEEKEYLAEMDEIDAYAHDIAMEIKFFYPRLHPHTVLKTIDKRKKIYSYSYYKRVFKKDDWSSIRSRLLKKTYNWLPYVTV